MIDRFEIFTTLIASISRSIRRIKTDEMVCYDLKAPHVSCLYYLYKEGPLTSSELCNVCEEDKASISRSVDYLLQIGYIEREVDEAKRYKKGLFLTDKGMELAEYVASKIDSILDRSSEGVTNEERDIMYKALAIISNNLKKISQEN